MSEVETGAGSQFHLANSSGTLIKLGEVFDVTLPDPKTEEIDVTHYESPNNRREYISGMIEDGEGTIQMNYVPGSATDVLIREAQASGAVRAFKTVLVQGAGTWEMTGSLIVKGYARSNPIGDRRVATLTVRFTGPSNEAAGA